MNVRTLRLLAWLVLGAVAIATLSPMEFRPRLPVTVDFERAGAFLLIGAIFAVAYPRQILFAAAVVLLSVLVLEAAQYLQPSRHGRVQDAVVKASAAIIGLGTGWLVAQLFRSLRRQTERTR